ncbi:MAG: tRNA (adenosine(37)-N6)-dimethylallyltransferase MiaA [bacterium]|nr:tRNA (adenosine(37)-N6)-dimethylallyltransferase MiaA [bacterium]
MVAMDGKSKFSGHVCPAIVGPTASGKTSLVTALAAKFPIEVISLDSRQIYHGLRIGTAQPTDQEQAICPHHLIDFVSPDEKYDGIKFRNDFEIVYRDIVQRGGVPILAGGAGMYLTALRVGFMEIPGHSSEALAEARAEVAQWGPQELRENLLKADPKSHERIHENDIYRSQRAMEIYLISGTSMTELTAAQQPNPCLGVDFPGFVLQREVSELDERIAQRTRQMLTQGWIEETETAMKINSKEGPGLRSIGYKEIIEFLDGNLSRENLGPAIVLATRQYAKRQRTWFRNLDNSTEGHPDSEELFKKLLRSLGSI